MLKHSVKYDVQSWFLDGSQKVSVHCSHCFISQISRAANCNSIRDFGWDMQARLMVSYQRTAMVYDVMSLKRSSVSDTRHSLQSVAFYNFDRLQHEILWWHAWSGILDRSCCASGASHAWHCIDGPMPRHRQNYKRFTSSSARYCVSLCWKAHFLVEKEVAYVTNSK